MKTKQSLKIYELLNKELEEPEKARIMTDAIERIIEEKEAWVSL